MEEKALVKTIFIYNRGDCYFINTSKHTILYLYDDRGMDVISIHANNLKALYKKYNEWILDYDREEIDALFNTHG